MQAPTKLRAYKHALLFVVFDSSVTVLRVCQEVIDLAMRWVQRKSRDFSPLLAYMGEAAIFVSTEERVGKFLTKSPGGSSFQLGRMPG